MHALTRYFLLSCLFFNVTLVSAMVNVVIPEYYKPKALFALKYFSDDAAVAHVIAFELAELCAESKQAPEFLDAPVDEYGNTLLHWAVNTQRTSIVSLLIAQGASVHVANRKSLTPFDLTQKYKTEAPHFFARRYVYKGRQEELMNGQLERMTCMSGLLSHAQQQQASVLK